MSNSPPVPINVFYEDEGSFKVGAILADNDTSLQVEAPHGKRSKIKASAVLLRFGEPALGAFMDAAQQVADGVDVDFLWQCCGADEFSFDTGIVAKVDCGKHAVGVQWTQHLRCPQSFRAFDR